MIVQPRVGWRTPAAAPDRRPHGADVRADPRVMRWAILATALAFLGLFIVLPLVNVFVQAFSKGLVGMMYTSAQTGIDSQAWDFTRYVTMVGGNHSMNVVIVNDAAFKRLSPEAQKAVLEAAAKAEARGWKLSEEVTTKHVQILKDKGMTLTEPSPQFRGELQKVGATLTEEWLKKAGETGQAAIRKFRE